MKLRALGIVLFLSFITSTFSQNNFLPGHVFFHHGDSLEGFIDYRNWDKNPRLIRFKKVLTATTVKFFPHDIAGFSVKDELYLSAIVETETSPSKTSLLQDGPELQLLVDTVFLQTLFRGAKSLFYFKDAQDEVNFYIQDSSEFQLLKHKRYFKRLAGEKFISQVEAYKGQLGYYLRDCPAIKNKILNTPYDKTSMEKLFQAYYKCAKPQLDFQKAVEKTTVRIGLLVGISSSQLKFNNSSSTYAYLSRADYESSNNFTGGIYVDLLLPRNLDRWSISNELIYNSFRFVGNYEAYRNTSNYSFQSTEIGFSYIKLNNMGRYSFPIGKGVGFINGGISNGIAFNETNNRTEERGAVNSVIIKEGKALESINKHELGQIVGLGARFSRMSIEARYERGNGITFSQYIRSITHRGYLLVGYQLN